MFRIASPGLPSRCGVPRRRVVLNQQIFKLSVQHRFPIGCCRDSCGGDGASENRRGLSGAECKRGTANYFTRYQCVVRVSAIVCRLSLVRRACQEALRAFAPNDFPPGGKAREWYGGTTASFCLVLPARVLCRAAVSAPRTAPI